MLLRAYQVNPCSWTKIIDSVRDNIHTLPEDTKTLYGNATTRQLRDRLSTKMGKLLSSPTNKIKNDLLREEVKMKSMETKLTKDSETIAKAEENNQNDKPVEVNEEAPSTSKPRQETPAADPWEDIIKSFSSTDEDQELPQLPVGKKRTVTEEDVETPPAKKPKHEEKPKKGSVMDLVKKNQLLYEKFITKKMPKLLRSLGVSSDSSDNE